MGSIDDEIALVAVKDDVDVTTARALDQAIQTVAGSGHKILVDLGACPYMDSSGISVLIKHAKRGERAFAVVARAGTLPHRVLTLTGVQLVLGIYETREAAAAALGAEPRPTA